MALLILALFTSSNDKTPDNGAGEQIFPNHIVSRSAGFRMQYPKGWAVWTHGWSAFIAPSLTPRLVARDNGLEADSGFSIQISEWNVYKYADYLKLLQSEFQDAKKAGASVVHSQLTVAGRRGDRFHVLYPNGASWFVAGDHGRFLRPCASCEAEYTLIRWPGSSWETPLRFDAVAHPDTKLSAHRGDVEAMLESLRSFDEDVGSHGYISMGPADLAHKTVTSYLEARIAGRGAEEFLEPAARRAYGRHLTLYWFSSETMAPSYQVLARVPLDAHTVRFQVLLEENCRYPHECPGRSAVEFLEVRVQGDRGVIFRVPECHQSSEALRRCLFAAA